MKLADIDSGELTSWLQGVQPDDGQETATVQLHVIEFGYLLKAEGAEDFHIEHKPDSEAPPAA